MNFMSGVISILEKNRRTWCSETNQVRTQCYYSATVLIPQLICLLRVMKTLRSWNSLCGYSR